MTIPRVLAIALVAAAACGNGGGATHQPDASPDAPAVPSTCGNTACDVGESCVNCTNDCGACAPGCGNGTCAATESCASCPADCGVCAAGCGDATCASGETCASCPLDCSCPTAGTRLATGGSLSLEDVSTDGAFVAYLTPSHVLYTVATSGATGPTQIATAVDKAHYKGGFLFAFHGVDVTGKVAASMDVFTTTGVTPIHTGNQVRVKSTLGSDDGQHYAYQRVASGNRDLILDGQIAFPQAQGIKAEFTSTSAYLVAAIWYQDVNANLVQPVISFPTSGGASNTLVADGTALRVAPTPSGSAVVVGENAVGGQADLTLVPITGGVGVPLATGDDNGFTVLPGGTTVVYTDAGALRAIGVNGTGGVTLVGSGVVAIQAVGSQSVLYATARDAITGLETLRVVRTTSGDVAVGAVAASESYTPDGTTLAARTDVVGGAGNLVIVPTSTLTPATLAPRVTKSSFADNQRIVYVDTVGALDVTALSGGAPALVQPRVTSFKLVPDGAVATTRGRAAYVLSTGVDAGLYITPF